MEIFQIIAGVAAAFLLALLCVFIGYSKKEEESCDGICSSCKLNCSMQGKTDKKEKTIDDK